MIRAGGASPPLVGRRSELEWLTARLDDALDGRPQVVLLSGHAGIGKSRLVREVQRIATERGADLCSGRCREQLDLPYLPLAGSLLPRIEPIVYDDPSLNRYASLVARILGRTDPSETVSPATPEQEKTWLFLAVARATTVLAQQRPLVLSIDDLQWADRASLELFTHVVLEISDAAVREPVPLLVLATLRPDLATAVATEVGRLERDEICHTLELAGLDEAETGEFVRALGLPGTSRRFVSALHRASIGNPLLLEHAVRQIQRSGLELERDFGPELVDLVAPGQSQVGAAVAPRLEGLSPECRNTLAALACLARPALVEELAGVVGDPTSELRGGLAEAVEAGVLTLDQNGYQFAHPLYARVAYAALPAAQRQRLHFTIATQLDALGPKHVLEVAHHVIDAGPAAPAGTVFERAKAGGQQAATMFAWADAARFYVAAATSARRLGQPSEVRADLHYRAGLAHFRNMDTGPALDNLGRAMELYRSTGNLRGYAYAATEHIRTQLVAGTYGATVDVTELDDALAELGDTDPALVSQVLNQTAEALWMQGGVEPAVERAQRALDLGHAADDDTACARALITLANIEWLRLNLRDAREHFAEARELARNAKDAWLEGNVVSRLALTHLWLGELDTAESTARDAVEIANRTGDAVERSFALGAQACIAALLGDFPAADRLGEAAWMAARIGRYEWSPHLFLPALAAARSSRGSYAAADAAIDRLVPSGATDPAVDDSLMVLRLLVWCRAGRIEDVRASALADPERIKGRWGVMLGAVSRVAASVEIADAVEVEVDWNVFDRYLRRVADGGMVLVDGVNTLVPRLRAIVARRLGQLDDAERHVQEAINICEGHDLRPELGRSLLERARVLALAAPTESARAIAAAERARAILDQLGMEPFVVQAAELLANLRGEPSAQPPRQLSPATRTETAIVAFADIAGSTELTEKMGDREFRAQATALEAELRNAVNACDGYAAEGVTLGDGVLALFSSGTRAVEFAAHAHEAAGVLGLRLHIGLNAGDVLRSDTSAFGGAVNVAARICDRAAAGETLVSEIVRTLVRTSSPVEFVDRGVHELKGVSDPHRLFAVVSAVLNQ